MSSQKTSEKNYRVVFRKLPINVFDNTSGYGILLFLYNPEASIDTPKSDASYVGRIYMYNNSAEPDAVEQKFACASTDVMESVARLASGKEITVDDFKIVVVQNDQQIDIPNELKQYFKHELTIH